MNEKIDEWLDRRDGGWYDAQGNPVSIREWHELEKRDPNFRIVQQTQLGFWWVSTVLLGLDHGWGRYTGDPDHRPVIFETMVFTRWKTYRRGYTFNEVKRPGYWCADSVDEKRYCTLAQAKGGHMDMVQRYRGWNGFKNVIRHFCGQEVA